MPPLLKIKNRQQRSKVGKTGVGREKKNAGRKYGVLLFSRFKFIRLKKLCSSNYQRIFSI
jgi:hypothetical protein